jgi:ParB-like chromosome segregation protein Spo0J
VTETIPIHSLDERYARLRIVKPAEERAVRDSMRRMGQLMPIVACERQAAFAVVDGFKRVAAARSLGIHALRARVMPLGEAAAIAALITFNRHGRGVSDLEEAMVVKALCRGEGLMQVEVAELVDRDKSWVCRRLSLAERLAETVADDMRAGLLSTTLAREIARLPRGNQAEVATSIRRHALTSHEAAELVTLLQRTSSTAQQRNILDKPHETLEAHGARIPAAVHDPRLGLEAQALYRKLHAALRASSDLCARLGLVEQHDFTPAERQVLAPALAKVHGTTEILSDKLEKIASAMKEV